MAAEIELSEEEEAALERAWARLEAEGKLDGTAPAPTEREGDKA